MPSCLPPGHSHTAIRSSLRPARAHINATVCTATCHLASLCASFASKAHLLHGSSAEQVSAARLKGVHSSLLTGHTAPHGSSLLLVLAGSLLQLPNLRLHILSLPLQLLHLSCLHTRRCCSVKFCKVQLCDQAVKVTPGFSHASESMNANIIQHTMAQALAQTGELCFQMFTGGSSESAHQIYQHDMKSPPLLG